MEGKNTRIGVIGLGMMGKEFASAAARWLHLCHNIPAPVFTGICDVNPASHTWFLEHVPSIRHAVTDYRELLEKDDIDVIYVASPHHLHEAMCTDTLHAGKHLMCEKPFGIDLGANEAIRRACGQHPDLLVRCASQMLFYPAAKMVLDWFRRGNFGRILQIKAGYKHSSDLNPLKPINWKRQRRYNGENGVMNDLGPHSLLVPLRAGVVPVSVTALLSDIVTERPNGKGALVPCDTWDNAMLLMDAYCGMPEHHFPFSLELQRIAPGTPNEWYLEVYGTDASIRYTTDNVNVIYGAECSGTQQKWLKHEIGYQPYYQTITGPLAPFGFGDGLLQMWAAFMDELQGSQPLERCMTPEETAACHRVFQGAVLSQSTGGTVRLDQ